MSAALGLDDPRWPSLRHAHGPAGDVPALLRRLARGEDAWKELYAALSPDGTIFSATYAAVPHVVEIAEAAAPEGQVDPLGFVGSVAAAREVDPMPSDLRAAYGASLRRAEQASLALLPQLRDEVDAWTVVGTIAACRGEAALARALGGFLDGELALGCPRCDADLFVDVDDLPFTVFAEDPSAQETARATQVAAPRSADGALADLIDLAKSSGQTSIAAKLAAWEGELSCPGCGRQFVLRELAERSATAGAAV